MQEANFMPRRMKQKGPLQTPALWWRRIRAGQRALGLRFYRQVVVLRRPVRLVIHIAARPSISLGLAGWTVNLNRRGADLRVAPGAGLALRRPLWRWSRLRLSRRERRGLE
jgi:hypothetical protein